MIYKMKILMRSYASDLKGNEIENRNQRSYMMIGLKKSINRLMSRTYQGICSLETSECIIQAAPKIKERSSARALINLSTISIHGHKHLFTLGKKFRMANCLL